MRGKKLIYLDNAATTRVSGEVLEEMLPYFSLVYCNPSAVYSFASDGRIAVDNARKDTADLIGAKQSEIYFTSGGTESNNWALKAAAESFEEKGKHIITTGTEHHSVINTCGYLERRGFSVTYLAVGEDGKVSLEKLQNAIQKDTILISVMAANNEIGTVAPVAQIGKIARENNILFHTDAVQAYGHIPLNVDEMNIDMLSASAHKINGPKGVGILYIRSGVRLRSFMHGGLQERGRRAGTLNVPGIAGMGKAARLAAENMSARSRKEMQLRDYFIGRVLDEIPHTALNGHRTDRLPNNANISFGFTEGETVLILLDQAGICASAGSACASGAVEASHVLTAIGLSRETARSSLRFTFSHENTIEEIDFTVSELKRIVAKLRENSAEYRRFAGN